MGVTNKQLLELIDLTLADFVKRFPSKIVEEIVGGCPLFPDDFLGQDSD